MTSPQYRFINPPPAPDLKWGVYVEDRLGITPVSYRLFGYDDPAEAWAQLLTLLERVTRNRIFYVKERGRQQRWTDFRKNIRYLFKHSRKRYYMDYKDFLDYASGRPRDEYKAPPPDEEPDEELLMIPDIAVDYGDGAADKRAVPVALKQALSTQSDWSKRQKKRRL